MQFLSKTKQKKEIKRLEDLKGDFMAEYKSLCEKYKAHLIPLIVNAGSGTFRLSMQIDVYKPLTPEMKEKIQEQTNQEQNGQRLANAEA